MKKRVPWTMERHIPERLLNWTANLWSTDHKKSVGSFHRNLWRNTVEQPSAIAAIKIADLEKQCLPVNKQLKKKKEWRVNFQMRIDNLRKEISKVMQISNTNQSAKLKKNANSMKIKYNIDTEEKRQTTLETLRHRLKALNNRLSRYLKRESRFNKTKSLSKSHRHCSIRIGSLLIPRLKKIKLSTSGDHCLRQKNCTTKKQYGSLNTSTQHTTSSQRSTYPS